MPNSCKLIPENSQALSKSGQDAVQAELDRLRRLERERALILDAAGEGIYGLDREGRGTFVNAAAMNIPGWTPDDLVGKVSHDLHHHTRTDGSPYPHEECPIYAALRDGTVHRIDDEVFRYKNGHCVSEIRLSGNRPGARASATIHATRRDACSGSDSSVTPPWHRTPV